VGPQAGERACEANKAGQLERKAILQRYGRRFIAGSRRRRSTVWLGASATYVWISRLSPGDREACELELLDVLRANLTDTTGAS
jgi:hypothetical protein